MLFVVKCFFKFSSNKFLEKPYSKAVFGYVYHMWWRRKKRVLYIEKRKFIY